MGEEKIALVTGANSGMGKATAIELARQGIKVVMLCRNKKRGEEAWKDVVDQSGNVVDLMICDLASLEDIRGFCESFKMKYNKLDILVNNAGVILMKRILTKDGFEMQFGVNHLGHFLLTNLLLDLLVAAAPSRVVVVSSGAHKTGRINFDDLGAEKKYHVWSAYSQSKLANILFTYELSRRLNGTGVTVNCLHPGAVATNMGIDRDTGFGKMITGLLKPFFHTSEEGAKTSVYLATSPDLEGITGKYFYECKEKISSKQSRDVQLAKKLWQVSTDLTGLN